MKSKDFEYDMEEKAYYSDDMMLDTKSEDSNKSRSCKDTLSKLEAKMERYKKPPLEKDFQYLMKLGLPSVGVNPHRLKVSKNVANKKFVKIFRKATP